MRTLVIDTATAACSVALFEDDRLVAHTHDVVGRGHAERLVPMIAALPDGGRADRVLVDVGPGSFTGIRVGIAAARALEKEGVSVEVVDVRSMLPLDMDTILASACKTGRVLVAYEDHEFMGFGAEIAAQIADRAFAHLDAPVKRLAGAFSWIGFAAPLEDALLPQDQGILAAARDLAAF